MVIGAKYREAVKVNGGSTGWLSVKIDRGCLPSTPMVNHFSYGEKYRAVQFDRASRSFYRTPVGIDRRLRRQVQIPIF